MSGQRRPRKSGISGRTLSGTLTAHGLTLWAHLVAVQQKMMRHADIRTTMNIYGDVVTDEMTTAGVKVSQLAFQGNGAQAERNGS